MHAKAQKVQETLDSLGLETQVRELPASTATAAEAARAVGTTIHHIAKTLVFVADAEEVLLVVAAGSNRVDTDRLADHLGAVVRMPDAATVRELTGYAVGGVPPVGHEPQPRTLFDRDLLDLETVWAAAGTPRAVFPAAPSELVRACAAEVVDLREEPGETSR